LRALRQRYAASVGGLSPVFWVIWWGTLVNRVASFVGLYLALFLREAHGFDEAESGWVVALWGLGSVVASPLGGVLADRLGRRATMLLGLVSGGFLVLAIALTRDPALLPPLCFLGGATQQVFFPASNAAIADVVPPDDRDRAYGLVYWAVNLGLASGFFFAGLVPMRYLAWLFVADACTTFFCAGLIAARVPETRPADSAHEPVLSGLVRALTDRTYLVLLVLQTAALTIFTQFQLALPLDMLDHGMDAQRFSFLMALNCLGVVVLQPWLTPLLRRFDPSKLVAVSAALFGLGYGLDALVSTFPMYLLGAAFWTVGEVVGFPAASSLVANLAPRSLRGRYQGLYSMVWGLGMMLSPVVGGQVMHRFGAPALWGGCLVAGFAVALGHLLSAGARRRRLAEVSAADQAAPGAAAAG
jgi:MFS family permease